MADKLTFLAKDLRQRSTETERQLWKHIVSITLPSIPSHQGRGYKEGVSLQGRRNKIFPQHSLKNLNIMVLRGILWIIHNKQIEIEMKLKSSVAQLSILDKTVIYSVILALWVGTPRVIDLSRILLKTM